VASVKIGQDTVTSSYEIIFPVKNEFFYQMQKTGLLYLIPNVNNFLNKGKKIAFFNSNNQISP